MHVSFIFLGIANTWIFMWTIDIKFVRPIVTSSKKKSKFSVYDKCFAGNIMIDNKLGNGECLLNQYRFENGGNW